MTDNKAGESILNDLIKKYKSLHDPDVLEFMVSCLFYVAKIKPHLCDDNPLNLMEMLCLILLAVGKNPDRCADLLGVSVNSIKTYEQRIRKKLGARNRLHAFYIAQMQGWISVERSKHEMHDMCVK